MRTINALIEDIIQIRDHGGLNRMQCDELAEVANRMKHIDARLNAMCVLVESLSDTEDQAFEDAISLLAGIAKADKAERSQQTGLPT